MSHKPRSRSKAKRKARRKGHSNGKRREMSKGRGTGSPAVVESREPLRSFPLHMLPEEMDESFDLLISDIMKMLKEDVEAEMRNLPKKDRKPATVHGKPYTPKDGAFLVQLIEPGKPTVTLLFGKNDLYLNGLHVSGVWFLMEGCNIPIPPKSQIPYATRTVPSQSTKSGQFTFKEGIYLLNWSGSYLELRGGQKQPFFHGAPQKARNMLSNAQSLVAEGLDCVLQPSFAFFVIFIPECMRFPEMRRWAVCHVAPGSVMGVNPPAEHRVMMRSWGTRSDDVYCPETPIEIRRSVDIIKRNPIKHSLLKLEVKYEKEPSPSVPCKEAVKIGADEDSTYKEGLAIVDNSVNEDDISDEEDVVGAIYEFQRHKDSIMSLACHPSDGLLALSGGADDKAYLWKVGSPEDAHELGGHEDTICSVAFSSDGALLACASLDGRVSIWTTSTGTLRTFLEGSGIGHSFEWVKWHPRGPLVMAGSDDSNIWLWNVGRVKDPPDYFMNIFVGHTKTVTCGDFTPDGKLICSGSDDSSLRVWFPQTAKTKCLVKGEDFHQTGLTCLTITKDSKFIYSCSKDGSLRVVCIQSGQIVGALNGHSRGVDCIGISAAGVVATGSRDSKLIIWDAASREAQHTCEHGGVVTTLVWLGQTRFLATGCSDGSVSIWDSVSGKCHASLEGNDGRVLALAAAWDLSSIISAGSDNLALCYDISELLVSELHDLM